MNHLACVFVVLLGVATIYTKSITLHDQSAGGERAIAIGALLVFAGIVLIVAHWRQQRGKHKGE